MTFFRLEFLDSILEIVDSILEFSDSILEIVDSILEFLDSILEIVDSILEFLDSILEIVDSILEFLDSILEIVDSILDTRTLATLLHVRYNFCESNALSQCVLEQVLLAQSVWCTTSKQVTRVRLPVVISPGANSAKRRLHTALYDAQ